MNENDVFFLESDTGILDKEKSECSYQKIQTSTDHPVDVVVMYSRNEANDSDSRCTLF